MASLIFKTMNIESLITPERINILVRSLLLLLLGLPFIYIASRAIGKYFTKHNSAHLGQMIQKLVFFAGLIIIVITILYEFGFKLTALLGSAGILSVAIGFAAQTSLSNIISGIFLYWERPFEVGDIIKVAETTGTVLSIDLMSVKMRQFDNIYIRIPNETMIKSQVSNITKFPIRRLDINIGVAYKEDVEKVIQVLQDVADKNPYSLDEPQPIVAFKDYGESSLNFMLGLWFEKTQYLLLKNSIMIDIKKRFDAEGIEIPFPHRTLYTGSMTEPFPIKLTHVNKTNATASREQV
ncbi:MAG: small-conductance mechanosensitive channel [Lentimonas sp.]|jgi:small-conductance mechanosensitive channel